MCCAVFLLCILDLYFRELMWNLHWIHSFLPQCCKPILCLDILEKLTILHLKHWRYIYWKPYRYVNSWEYFLWKAICWKERKERQLQRGKERGREWRERKHSGKGRNSHTGLCRQTHALQDVEYPSLKHEVRRNCCMSICVTDNNAVIQAFNYRQICYASNTITWLLSAQNTSRYISRSRHDHPLQSS